METRIGQAFHRDPRIAAITAIVGVIAIGIDFAIAKYLPYRTLPRVFVAGAALSALLLLARGDTASLGLTHRMNPGYRYWVKMTLIINWYIAV